MDRLFGKLVYKRLTCWICGSHDWKIWILVAPNGDRVEYEKCARCGTFKDDGKKKLRAWTDG